MDIKLFALNASKTWGEKVAKHLGLPALSSHEEREFGDGEHKVRPLERVRGKSVFVIQSLYADNNQSVNDKLCRLLFFIGALKDASAAHLTAVIPYFAYARKDRKTKPRDPITMKYMAQLIEASGVNHMLTMDIHNLSAFQNAFRIPSDHLQAMDLFVPYCAHALKSKEIVIVSPDEGGIKRVEEFRDRLSDAMNQPIEKAFLHKKRSFDQVSGGKEIIGDVRKKTAIIMDDIISSGKTLELAAQALDKAGAERIWVCASHGIFIQNANRILASSAIEKIIISNSIEPFRLKSFLLQKTVILDAAPLFAKAIQLMHQ